MILSKACCREMSLGMGHTQCAPPEWCSHDGNQDHFRPARAASGSYEDRVVLLTAVPAQISAILALALLLSACVPPPVSSTQTPGPPVAVHYASATVQTDQPAATRADEVEGVSECNDLVPGTEVHAAIPGGSRGYFFGTSTVAFREPRTIQLARNPEDEPLSIRLEINPTAQKDVVNVKILSIGAQRFVDYAQDIRLNHRVVLRPPTSVGSAVVVLRLADAEVRPRRIRLSGSLDPLACV